jgi:hypothetical protein
MIATVTPLVVLGAGFVVILAGIILAWTKRGGGAFLVLLVGLAMVVVSGPGSRWLQQFSFFRKDIDVSYAIKEPRDAMTREQASRVATTVFSVAGTADTSDQDTGNAPHYKVQDQYRDYFLSIGFIPTDIVGTANLVPGTIITYKNGLPVVWANQEQAYPGLKPGSAYAGIAELVMKDRGGTPGTPVGTLDFHCASGAHENASLLDLETLLQDRVADSLGAARDQEYFVVYETLACRRLDMELRVQNGTPEPQTYDFRSPDRVVVGYKLAKVTVLDRG